MTEELQKKVDRAIKLLQSYKKSEPIEVSYSSGKDSDVILELVKMAGIPYRAIYKSTTIDPPGTIKHAREMGAEVIRPNDTVFHVVERYGTPSRFSRFCCRAFKEYKVLDDAVHGIRKGESKAREDRYKEPVVCRLYDKKDHVNVFLPILDWTNEDVAEFVAERGIKCHPLYYDEKGGFHPERRLGCMGCPLAGAAKRRRFFKENPKMLRLWMKAYNKYLSTHTDKHFDNPHDKFFFDLWCRNMAEYRQKKHNLFGTLDTKQFLEEYFGIDLTF